MIKKIRKNIHIAILEYANEHSEFTLNELMRDLDFNQNEKDLLSQHLVNEKSVFQGLGRNKPTEAGQESLFMISTEGRFKLLEYEQLKNATESSEMAIEKSITAIEVATFSAVLTFVAVIVAVITAFINFDSLKKAQLSLELNSQTSLSLEDNNPHDPYAEKIGYINAPDYVANFVLTNNPLLDVVDVSIRPVLLKMSKDKKNNKIDLCFFGYVGSVDESVNKQFIVGGNILIDTISTSTFNLSPSEKHTFSIDYKNFIKSIPKNDEFNYLFKIDVSYRRKVDNKSFNYSKFYHIWNSENLVDIDINPLSITYANELKSSSSTIPNAIYPFRDHVFFDKVKINIASPYKSTSPWCVDYKY